MKNSVVFDDLASIFHLFLGIVAGIKLHTILSLLIITIYTVYQVLDKKDTKTEKLGDFIELIVGFMIGSVI